MNPVAITFKPSWRALVWDADVPSRQAWILSCAEHPGLGRDSGGEPWGYSTSGQAHGVATRHLRVQHADQVADFRPTPAATLETRVTRLEERLNAAMVIISELLDRPEQGSGGP